MICDICYQKVEYDEADYDGDGYVCFECTKEEKFGDLKHD